MFKIQSNSSVYYSPAAGTTSESPDSVFRVPWSLGDRLRPLPLYCFQNTGFHIDIGVSWAGIKHYRTTTLLTNAVTTLLMTITLISAVVHGSHISLATAPSVWTVLWTAMGAGAVFIDAVWLVLANQFNQGIAWGGAALPLPGIKL